MKHLFLARHGKYMDDDLTAEGRQQAQKLAEAMKAIAGYNSTCIVSSTAPRAKQTAEILAAAFGLESFVKEPNLWVEHEDDLDLWKLQQVDGIFRQYAAAHDTVILVSHISVVRCYPNYFISKYWGLPCNVGQPGKGEAAYLSEESRDARIIPG